MIVFLDSGIIGLLSLPNDRELDADIIIAAHWLILTEEYPGQAVTIATTNVGSSPLSMLDR